MNQYKVIYFHPSNELYGADRSLLRLVKSLDKEKYLPYVVVPNDLQYEGLLTKELQENVIPFKEVKLGVLRRKYFTIRGIGLLLYWSLTSAIQLARFVRKEKINLIHSNSTAVITGGLVSRLTGVPHVWHVREIITEPKWLNKVIVNNLNIFSDKVVSVSGPTKDNLVVSQPKLDPKTVVIHNGIDSDRFKDISIEETVKLRTSWDVDNKGIVIGMVGRISAWKGQEFLMRAAVPILRKYPYTKLVLVGSSVPGETVHKETLMQLIVKERIEDQVVVEKFRSDIPLVLASFDIFVLPSTRPDPFPTVVLEAMAAGKPVIATAHGGAIEQVKDGITGFLVSPVDTNCMTNSLEELINKPSLCYEMGVAGRRRVLENFTVKRYINNMDNLYQSMLSE